MAEYQRKITLRIDEDGLRRIAQLAADCSEMPRLQVMYMMDRVLRSYAVTQPNKEEDDNGSE